MAAKNDSEGVARARRIESDNQHSGRGAMGYTRKPGTHGTGHDGNGSQGGGINRSTKPTPQH